MVIFEAQDLPSWEKLEHCHRVRIPLGIAHILPADHVEELSLDK